MSTIVPSIPNAGPALAAIGPLLFFAGDDGKGFGEELYRSLFTPKTTTLIADLHRYHPGATQSSKISSMSAIGSSVHFSASDGIHGYEAWTSDGTTSGTRRWSDINPRETSSYPGPFIDSPNGLLFRATSPQIGAELWTLPRGKGPKLVLDVAPGFRSGHPRNFLSMGGLVYFVSEGPGFAHGIYATDGTRAGTKQITPSVAVTPIVRMHDALYWLDGDFPNRALMRSDGSSRGRAIASLRRSTGAGPTPLQVVGDRLFVIASTNTTGTELWVSDGKTVSLTKDIIAGSRDARPSHLTTVGDLVFFTANTPTAGRELWRSDGSAAGTFMVRDIIPRAYSSLGPTQLLAVGDECWFAAYDGTSNAIWKSAGSSADTRIVARTTSGVYNMRRIGESILFDIADVNDPRRMVFHAIDRKSEKIKMLRTSKGAPVLSPTSSFSRGVGALAHGRYYFPARSDEKGEELHVWTPGAVAQPFGANCAGPGRNPRLDADAPRLGQNWTIEGAGFQAQNPIIVFLGAPTTRPTPLSRACDLYIDLATYLPIGAEARSRWSKTNRLPNDARLLGTTFAVQSLQVARDRALGFDVSSALHVSLGR